jgi:hypothetical protein
METPQQMPRAHVQCCPIPLYRPEVRRVFHCIITSSNVLINDVACLWLGEDSKALVCILPVLSTTVAAAASGTQLEPFCVATESSFSECSTLRAATRVHGRSICGRWCVGVEQTQLRSLLAIHRTQTGEREVLRRGTAKPQVRAPDAVSKVWMQMVEKRTKKTDPWCRNYTWLQVVAAGTSRWCRSSERIFTVCEPV